MAEALLPVSADGTLVLATALLRWIDPTQGDSLTARTLPVNNAALPDLLALAGISELRMPGSRSGRWIGAAGSVLAILGDPPLSGPGQLAPEHHGTLPTTPLPGWVASTPVAGLETAARVADGRAVFDTDAGSSSAAGAPWDAILDHIVRGDPPPALAHVFTDHGPNTGSSTALGAWNPLAFARRSLVMLPFNEVAPPALVDSHGARHPVQVVAGPTGEPHGMLIDIELGALAATTLAPDDRPASGAMWEASARVLDNGRVRAEFDDAGRIARLSWDGVFAEWSGPAVAPLIDGAPFAASSADAVVRVWESGPVRALISVTRSGPTGTLELSYVLHAHEDALRISARYDGTGRLELDHPTTHAVTSLVIVDELREYAFSDATGGMDASGSTNPRRELRGVRWASLGDRAGRGVAVAAGEPFALRVEHGRMLLPVNGRLGYALLRASRPGPWRASAGLAVPHLAYAGPPRPARFRLVAPPHVATAWLRPCAGWQGELMLVDQSVTRSRAFLYPTRLPGDPPGAAVKVDAFGRERSPVKATPEDDGFQIELAPGEIALVRWR